MKLGEMTDKQLAAVYKNCRKSTRTCDGCLMFGANHCRNELNKEMAKRFVAMMEGKG